MPGDLLLLHDDGSKNSHPPGSFKSQAINSSSTKSFSRTTKACVCLLLEMPRSRFSRRTLRSTEWSQYGDGNKFGCKQMLWCFSTNTCQAVSCLCQSNCTHPVLVIWWLCWWTWAYFVWGYFQAGEDYMNVCNFFLQTMCPWSKTFLCTSQNDEPLPGRNALPNVAIHEKRAAATVFSHCSWGYFLLAALFFFVYAQSRLALWWPFHGLGYFIAALLLSNIPSNWAIRFDFAYLGYTSFIFFKKKHMKQCSRIQFQM